MSTWSNLKGKGTSRRKAMAMVGAVVYAARLADGTIKIGHTEHFADRLRYLQRYTGQDVELLAFRPGTYEDEQAIHASLVPHRVDITPQAREYYSPAPEVMAVVNDMRATLDMPPLAA